MQKQSSLRSVIIGVVILILCVLAVFGFRYAKKVQRDKNAVHSISSAKVLGPDSAPIRIVDFSDFQCPACSHATKVLDALMAKYPGKIQLVFKHFPLRMHVWAGVTHQAAECAAEQGKFWEYYKKLYDNQQAWSVLPDPMVSIMTYAQETGLAMDDFSRCLADPVTADHIASEKKEGETLEVKSTPTFFVNGKMFAGGIELQKGGEELIRKTLGLPPLPPAPETKTEVPAAAAPEITK